MPAACDAMRSYVEVQASRAVVSIFQGVRSFFEGQGWNYNRRELFATIRTLDPDHVATTQTSTSHARLLNQPRRPAHEIRTAITMAPIRAKLPPRLLETQMLVRSDAYHIRVTGAPKKDPPEAYATYATTSLVHQSQRPSCTSSSIAPSPNP